MQIHLNERDCAEGLIQQSMRKWEDAIRESNAAHAAAHAAAAFLPS